MRVRGRDIGSTSRSIALLSIVLAACSGTIVGGGSGAHDPGPGSMAGQDGASGSDGSAAAGAGQSGAQAGAGGGGNEDVCDPLPARVSRLQDRQLANAMRDLLDLDASPELRTSSSSREAFIPNAAAAVSGAVALELRDVAEEVAVAATAEGKPAIECSGDERVCAEAFIERFGNRAFHAPIDDDAREQLLELYDIGLETYGGHAGGIRVVIEGVLQAPSFLYVRELGGEAGQPTVELSAYELATKLALFLLDGAPDDALWAAAESGALSTDAGLRAEIDRLLEQPVAQRNVTAMFRRLFQLDRIHEISKAQSITAFSPELVEAMYGETERFIDEQIWRGEGTLAALLTSRTSFLDARMAEHYGVEHPGGDAIIETELEHRAGILTQPSLMTIEALPDQSSVVHRGVFLARELLCFHPPAPMASDLMQGQAFKEQEPTERGRAGLRAMNNRCRGCHGFFDPLGLAFENYDTLGRYRTEIETPDGPVPVDATSTPAIHDIQGEIDGALELSEMLSQSEAVRACVARQLASYALGARIDDGQACTVDSIVRRFEESGGDLQALIIAVATWEGLRVRSVGDEP